MRARRVVCVIAVLLLAVPAMAQPADGEAGWWSWLAEGWDAVVRVFAGSEEPADEPTTEPVEPDDAVLVCLPVVGCVEVDDGGDTLPGLDPDG